MRTTAKFFSVYLFVLFICLHLQAQQPPQQPPKPVRLEKLSDNLYQALDGRGAQGGVYIGNDAVMLIDSKMDSASVMQELEAVRGLTDKPIRYVAHTHADGDHVRGNRFQPAGVAFMSHENCRKEMLLPGRDGKPSEFATPGMLRCLPSITFSERMDIYFGAKKIELWYFGVGHTTGDAVIYFPDEKTAFIGDLIFLTRVPLIHAYKGGNSFEEVKALERMLKALDAVRFCSGHSDPVDRDGVAAYIAAMKERQEKIRGLLSQGKSLDDVKKEFAANESGLVEIIFNEIKSGK
jgi:glyoxylase-like metal-dependent hydrolase (beta-lactamase superfamily II)